MISPIIDKFQRHPRDVGETYWEHSRHALGFASHLFVAAGACFVHAILPFFFTSTGSAAVKNLYSRMALNRSKVPVSGMEDSAERRTAGDVVVGTHSKA